VDLRGLARMVCLQREIDVRHFTPEIFSPSISVCGTIAAAMTPEIVANAIVAAPSAGAVAGATGYRQVGHR
jgi:hypothetical protein